MKGEQEPFDPGFTPDAASLGGSVDIAASDVMMQTSSRSMMEVTWRRKTELRKWPKSNQKENNIRQSKRLHLQHRTWVRSAFSGRRGEGSRELTCADNIGPQMAWCWCSCLPQCIYTVAEVDMNILASWCQWGWPFWNVLCKVCTLYHMKSCQIRTVSMTKKQHFTVYFLPQLTTNWAPNHSDISKWTISFITGMC